MQSDIRLDWRINDIERALREKAESHQLESIRCNVDRLECSLREACSTINELRNRLEASIERIERLEQSGGHYD